MKSLFTLLACSILFPSPSAGAETYDARIAEKQILTPVPPAAPRINGPVVCGARPGNPFLYRIPTQGQRPLRFEVKDLPDGLKLDADKGILTGVTPARKGDHLMTFTAKNGHGEISSPFKIVVGDKLALTPPTGWNSWGGQMIHVSDAVMRKAADMMVERGLADVGFQYVGIDDCWMRLNQEMYDRRQTWTVKKHSAYDHISTKTIGPIRDESGNILPNGKFPDMKAMTDYIHSHGLKAGIYSSPGVKTCQEWAGSYGHESADADQYAEWGFDLLKYDQCSGGEFLKRLRTNIPGFKIKDFWAPMSNYLRSQNRDILFNLCQYGHEARGPGHRTWASNPGARAATSTTTSITTSSMRCASRPNCARTTNPASGTIPISCTSTASGMCRRWASRR